MGSDCLQHRHIFKEAGNSAIDVLNDLVALLNTALKKWNDLKFEAGGFHKTIPAWTPLMGASRLDGTQSR